MLGSSSRFRIRQLVGSGLFEVYETDDDGRDVVLAGGLTSASGAAQSAAALELRDRMSEVDAAAPMSGAERARRHRARQAPMRARQEATE